MRPSCSLIRRPHLFVLPVQWTQRRQLLTLAIETSCDDTSVAVLEKHNDEMRAILHFHSKITSDNRPYGGVHPITSHESHQKNLASLVNQALTHLPLLPATRENASKRELARLSPTRRQASGQEHTAEEAAGQNKGAAEKGAPPFDGLLVENDNGSKYLRRKPDFITVTRGPGMRASLTTGLDTAKGLAVAWQIPLIGVNHMQAHALTPRMISALRIVDSGAAKSDGVTVAPGTKDRNSAESHMVNSGPDFPFLSLLVSGGHTMLVHSRSLCDHEILANTTDLAVGDMLDKTAREVLPRQVIDAAEDVMYGKSLQSFAFPKVGNTEPTYDYDPPSSFTRPRHVNLRGYEWTTYPPYAAPGPGGSLRYAGDYTFSGMGSSIKGIMTRHPEMDDDARRVVAREAMVMAFEHLASRLLFALKRSDTKHVKTVVVSGGVAGNQFLRVILRETLNAKGHNDVKLIFPPPKFCSDNAAMIAWTGIEMYEAGWRTSLDATAVKKWPIDPKAEGGGILGLDGWQRRFDPATEEGGASGIDFVGEVILE